MTRSESSSLSRRRYKPPLLVRIYCVGAGSSPFTQSSSVPLFEAVEAGQRRRKSHCTNFCNRSIIMQTAVVIHETSNYCTVFTLSRSFLHKPNLDSLLSTQLNKNSSYWFKLWSDYGYTSLYSNLSPLHHHLTYSSVPVWLLLDPSSSISLFLLVSRYLSAGTRVSVVSIFAAIISNVSIAIL